MKNENKTGCGKENDRFLCGCKYDGKIWLCEECQSKKEIEWENWKKKYGKGVLE